LGIINGTLLAYYEQGWHGRIEFYFQPDDSKEFIPLQNGQLLTIFDEDGKLLWSGKIELAKRGLFDNHKYVWANSKQKGVSYGQWLTWYWTLPPLQAQLEIMDEAMNETQKDHPNINKNIHPPIVALLYMIAAFLLGRFVPIPFTMPDILRDIGFALIVIGFLFGAGAFAEFRKANTTLDPHGSVSGIVTTGVYQFTRNPIYFGLLLILIGFPLNSGIYWGLALAPFFIVTMNRLVIEREEAYLEKKFGDVYTAYRSRVRRWL
jgi:protein-S-isoprenylcysteine O-methyltransferase Ste14